MSTAIDERVVSMKFDNSNFEKNVAQSMSTIEKLKKALNFKDSAKGLEEINKATKGVSLDGISSAIDNISNKFSTMGIIGVTALQNITNKAVDAGIKLVKSLSTDNISAGWGKYNQKVEGVQTIMAATGLTIDEVNGSLEKLNWFTDETSYNFTDMINSIGKFTSAGLSLDDSVSAMEGIANWAAISGVNTSKAYSAFYNLSQAVSSGAMKLQDWKSIENVNMNTKEFKQTVIETALAMGKLQKVGDGVYKALGSKNTFTNESFSTDLKSGWFDKEVIMATLKQYGAYADAVYDVADAYDTCSDAMKAVSSEGMDLGARAFKAAQEAKTLEDAIGSVKDAVSTGWMNTFELIFGNYEEAKTMWTDLANDLWDIFASGGEKRNSFIKDVLSDGAWSKLQKKLKEIGIDEERFSTALIEAARENGTDIDTLIERYGSLSASFKVGWFNANVFNRALENMIGTEDIQAIEGMTGSLKGLEVVVNDVLIGKFGNGADRVKKLTEAGYDYAQVQDLVNRTKRGEIINYEELSDAQLKNVGMTEEQIAALRALQKEAQETGTDVATLIERMNRPSGRSLIIESFKNVVHTIKEVLDTAKSAWSQIFNEDYAEKIYQMIVKFNNFTKTLKEAATGNEKLERTFKGLFAIIDIVRQLIGAVFKALSPLLGGFGKLGSTALDVTANMGDFLVALDENIKEFGVFTKAAEKIAGVLSFLGNAFWNFFETVFTKGFGAIKVDPSEMVSKAVDGISKVVIKFLEFIEKTFNVNLTDLKNSISTNLEESKSIITGFINDVITSTQEFWTHITNEYEEGGKGLKGAIEVTFDALQKMSNGFFAALSFITGKDLTSVADKVASTLELAGDELEKFIDKVTGGFKNDVPTFFKDLYDSIQANGLGPTVLDFLGKLGDKLKEFKTNVIDKLDIDPAKVAAFVSVIATISSLRMFAGALDKVSSMMDTLSGGILGTIKAVKGVVSEYQKSIKYNNLIKIALAIGALVASIAILTTLDPQRLKSASIVMLELAGAIGALTIILGVLSKVAPNFGSSATGILLISAAMGILVLSLKVLDTMSLDGIQDKLKVMGEIALGLVVVSAILSKISPKMSGGGLGILAFAISLGIIVKTLADVADTDMSKLSRGLKNLVPVMILLAAVSLIIKGVKFGSAMGLLLFVVSLKTTVAALMWVADSVDIGKLKSKLSGLITVLGIVTLLCADMRIAGKNAAKAGVGMLLISGAMILLGLAMKSIGKMGEEDLKKALGALTVLGAVMGILMYCSQYTEKLNLKGLTLLIVSLLVIGAELMLLTAFDWQDIMASAVALSSVLLSLGACMVLMTGNKLDGKDLVAIAESMLLVGTIGASLALIAQYDWKNILAAATGLSVTMVAVAYALKSLQRIDGRTIGSKKLEALKVSILMLAGVAAALVAVSRWGGDWDRIIAAAAGISLCLVALGKTFDIIANMPKLKNEPLTMLFTALALLAPIVGALVILGNFGGDWQQMLASAVSLSAVLLALSVSFGIIGLIKSDDVVKNAGALLLASLALFPVAGAIQMLAGYSWDDMIPGVVAMSGTLIALTAVVSALALVTKAVGAGNVFAAEAELGVLLVGLTALLALAGYLNDHFDLATKVVHGLPIMNALAQGIGQFVGNLISGVAVGLSAGMPEFADNLTQFSVRLQPFLNNMKNVDDGLVESVKNICEAILCLVGTEFLNSIANAFLGEKDIEQFGQQLVHFAAMLVQFSNIVKNGKVDGEAVQSAATAGKMLAEFASAVPNSGGKLAEWVGDNNDLQEWGNQLVAFGEALVKFSDTITKGDGIDVDAIEGAANAGKMLADFAHAVPNSGGKLAEWLGDNNIDQFGARLVSFGKCLVKFSDTITEGNGIDVKAVEDAANAGKMLAEFAHSIPNSGGKLANWLGDNNIDEFGRRIVIFGQALVDFSDTVSGKNGGHPVDALAVTTATLCGQLLANLESNLPETAGLKGWFSGKVDLEDFGSKLAQFGYYLSAYSEQAVLVDANAVESTAKATQALVDLVNDVSTLKDLKGMDHFIDSVEKLGSDFVVNFCTPISVSQDTVGAAVTNMLNIMKANIQVKIPEITNKGRELATSFLDAIKGRNQEAIATGKMIASKVAEGISSYYSTLQSIGIRLAYGFILGVKDKYSEARSAGEGLVTQVVNGISGSYDKAQTAGATLITKFNEGIKSKYSEANGVGRELAVKVADGLSGYYDTFQAVGVRSAYGYVLGLKDKYGDSFSAGQGLVNIAIEGIASKNQDMYDAGTNMAAGFANGITDHLDLSVKASEAMASSAVAAAQHILDINSPSKVFYKIGAFVVEGYANAVNKLAYRAVEATEQMAADSISPFDDVKNRLVDIISGDLDLNPVITPILDLSYVRSGARELSSMFSANMEARNAAELQNGVPGAITNVNYTQNNYSPEALSRLEIYRQTRNQLSTLKGLV